MMPDVDGFDVVRTLHEHPDTARIPILVVTAKQITEDDRARLDGRVTTIVEKAEVERERLHGRSSAGHGAPPGERLTWPGF